METTGQFVASLQQVKRARRPIEKPPTLARSIGLLVLALECAASPAAGQVAAVWGPLHSGDCTRTEQRQVSAEYLAPAAGNRRVACEQATRNVMGRVSKPVCRTSRFLGIFPTGVRGYWNVPDARCLAVPPARPAPSTNDDLPSPEPLEGYADIHVHQMANLGFGGSVVWGAAFGSPDTALAPIPDQYRPGHETVEAATTGRYVQAFVNGRIRGEWHGEHGAPDFSSWPRSNIWTHQQVYEDWLFRAYRGGLRLMVMLAANSEDPFGRGENGLGPLSHRVFQPVKMPGRSGNDMESLEWQIREAYRMQAAIDLKAGGPGRGWYRIVRDPEEAGAAIAQGKLAVILGTELQHLFNCDADRPDCSKEDIVDGLNRLEGMGVSYVFPIHHKSNQFGGPAMFQPLNFGSSVKCHLEHKCSTEGLQPLGRFLMSELMARGMLIDTEHMSRLAFAGALDLAEAVKDHYPVMAGHIVPFDLQDGGAQTERARTADELRRIFRVGGMVAPILSVGSGEYTEAQIPLRCDDRHGQGGPDRWANVYFFLRDLAAQEGGLTRGIPFGGDWNGFAGWPGPRIDSRDGCKPRQTDTGKHIEVEAPFDYPIVLPPSLVPAASGGTPTLELLEWPAGRRTWHYNAVGVAHIGMLPDFVQNLRQLGVSLGDLEPVYRSARGVVNVWKAARTREVPGDRHTVRWVPDSPFDVLPFEYRDDTRSVHVSDGYPLCKRRGADVLGYVANGRCIPVVTPSPASARATDPRIVAYHSGQCLDSDSSSRNDGRAIQRTCSNQPHQRWTPTHTADGHVQLRNDGSGLCLTAMDGSNRRGARPTQHPCSTAEAQHWSAVRSGNTFSLRATTLDLCLEVDRESRDDDAAVRQRPCSGAAHQLWSIEALRANDFERLYQTMAGATEWAAAPTDTHSEPVLIGGRAICRSVDPARWAGTVDAVECRGTDYNGAAVTSGSFERLFQRP